MAKKKKLKGIIPKRTPKKQDTTPVIDNTIEEVQNDIPTIKDVFKAIGEAIKAKASTPAVKESDEPLTSKVFVKEFAKKSLAYSKKFGDQLKGISRILKNPEAKPVSTSSFISNITDKVDGVDKPKESPDMFSSILTGLLGGFLLKSGLDSLPKILSGLASASPESLLAGVLEKTGLTGLPKILTTLATPPPEGFLFNTVKKLLPELTLIMGVGAGLMALTSAVSAVMLAGGFGAGVGTILKDEIEKTETGNAILEGIGKTISVLGKKLGIDNGVDDDSINRGQEIAKQTHDENLKARLKYTKKKHDESTEISFQEKQLRETQKSLLSDIAKVHQVPTITEQILDPLEPAQESQILKDTTLIPTKGKEMRNDAVAKLFSAAIKDNTKREQLQELPLGDLATHQEGGYIGSAHKDNKGWAYGEFQLNSEGQLPDFLKSNPYYSKQLEGMKPGSSEFNTKWEDIAKADPENFEKAQRNFVIENTLKPNLEYAEKLGYDTKNRAIQEAIFSGAIQHGGIKEVLKGATKGKNFSKLSPKEQLDAFYDERSVYADKYVDPNAGSIRYNKPGGERQKASMFLPFETDLSNINLSKITERVTSDFGLAFDDIKANAEKTLNGIDLQPINDLKDKLANIKIEDLPLGKLFNKLGTNLGQDVARIQGYGQQGKPQNVIMQEADRQRAEAKKRSDTKLQKMQEERTLLTKPDEFNRFYNDSEAKKLQAEMSESEFKEITLEEEKKILSIDKTIVPEKSIVLPKDNETSSIGKTIASETPEETYSDKRKKFINVFSKQPEEQKIVPETKINKLEEEQAIQPETSEDIEKYNKMSDTDKVFNTIVPDGYSKVKYFGSDDVYTRNDNIGEDGYAKDDNLKGDGTGVVIGKSGAWVERAQKLAKEQDIDITDQENFTNLLNEQLSTKTNLLPEKLRSADALTVATDKNDKAIKDANTQPIVVVQAPAPQMPQAIPVKGSSNEIPIVTRDQSSAVISSLNNLMHPQLI